jgi:ribosome biogenesis GTPase
MVMNAVFNIAISKCFGGCRAVNLQIVHLLPEREKRTRDMKLEELGYSSELENFRQQHGLDTFDVGRVIAEHRERYRVRTVEGEFEAEIIGNLRFSARERSDFPAVGDWVAVSAYDADKVLIHSIFPRRTILERAAVGKEGEKQIIATNIDDAFIIQALDRDFSLNRFDRYLSICYKAGVRPVLVLNKADLVDQADLDQAIQQAGDRFRELPLVVMSNETRSGYEDLRQHIRSTRTCCLLGSSGVGKSTLINNLTESSRLQTGAISSSTNRGKHVTSHRELVVLETGGILIDNPGMREVGIADAAHGLEATFEDITGLAKKCRYADCSHVHESGCAVMPAVEEGRIDPDQYTNYLRMLRESAHFESSIAEKRRKDKDFGKVVREHKKFKNRNRD